MKIQIIFGINIIFTRKSKKCGNFVPYLKHNMYGDSDYSIYRVSACTADPAFL